jgi:glycosyltransferase involved in cell wall biosynthesis
MTVSLIITTYNREDALLAVLESAMRQTRLPDEVLVADDGSLPATLDVVLRVSGSAVMPVLHVWQEDQGFRAARCRNMAMARAQGDYLVLVDGDMLLDTRFIADHLYHARPGLFLQGGRVLLDQVRTVDMLAHPESVRVPAFWSPGMSGRHKMIHSLVLSEFTSPVDTSMRGSRTCNFSLWRRDAVAVNGFNEAFCGWGREDSDLVARLFFLGLKRKCIRFGAIGYHLYHREQSRDSLSANDTMLRQTMAAGQYWCTDGMDKHHVWGGP